MHQEISRLLGRYSRVHVGDIRFSLCLRDAGILMTHSPRFNGVPPNDNLDYLDPIDYAQDTYKQMSYRIYV